MALSASVRETRRRLRLLGPGRPRAPGREQDPPLDPPWRPWGRGAQADAGNLNYGPSPGGPRPMPVANLNGGRGGGASVAHPEARLRSEPRDQPATGKATAALRAPYPVATGMGPPLAGGGASKGAAQRPPPGLGGGCMQGPTAARRLQATGQPRHCGGSLSGRLTLDIEVATGAPGFANSLKLPPCR